MQGLTFQFYFGRTPTRWGVSARHKSLCGKEAGK